jgi:hypothetical protein
MQPLLVITLVTCASVAQDFRWTDKVRVKRETGETEPDPDMEVIASDLKGLTYIGEI